MAAMTAPSSPEAEIVNIFFVLKELVVHLVPGRRDINAQSDEDRPCLYDAQQSLALTIGGKNAPNKQHLIKAAGFNNASAGFARAGIPGQSNSISAQSSISGADCQRGEDG